MFVLKTLDDLADWNAYRELVKAELASLRGETSVFVSKSDFAFEVGGSTYSGRAVLFGPRGATSAANLKRQGLSWREGTVELRTDTLYARDIPVTIIAQANQTLARLLLGISLRAETPGHESTAERSSEPPAAPPSRPTQETAEPEVAAALALPESLLESSPETDPAATSAPEPPSLTDYLKDLLRQVRSLTGRPNESEPIFIAESPSRFEHEGRVVRMRRVGLGRGAMAQALELRQRGLELCLGEANSEAGKLLVAGIAAELIERAKGELAALKLRFGEALEAAVDTRTDESAEPAQLQGSQPQELQPTPHDLTGYRKALRNRLRQLAAAPTTEVPIFISRTGIAFQQSGSPVRILVVLIDPGSEATLQSLRDEEGDFLEGIGTIEDDAVVVRGIPDAIVAKADRALAALKIGFSIRPSLAP